MSPAELSWEERGLISQTVAGNRACTLHGLVVIGDLINVLFCFIHSKFYQEPITSNFSADFRLNDIIGKFIT